MPTVKKLTFALPFLISIFFLYQLLPSFLGDTNLIFGFSIPAFTKLLIFSILLITANYFFILFACLAQDFKLVLPVSVLGTSLAILFFELPLSLMITGGSLISFILIFLSLQKKLSSYLTFHASALLLPSVSQVITLLLLVFTVGFYFVSNNQIQTKGFKIPDALIDASLRFATQPGTETEASSTSSIPGLPQISPEQIQLLKQNPEVLKQYGLDPSILDQLENPNQSNPKKNSNPQTNFLKSAVQSQTDSMIKPYLNFIPIILAVLFFFTVKWFTSIISVILAPFTWLIFWILEKSGFITFQVEMREVKKLIV